MAAGKFVVVVLEGGFPSGGSRSIAGRFKLPGEPRGVYVVDRVRRGALNNLVFRVDESSGLYLVAYDVRGDERLSVELGRRLEREGCARLAASVYACTRRVDASELQAQGASVDVLVLPVSPLRPEDAEYVRQALAEAGERG